MNPVGRRQRATVERRQGIPIALSGGTPPSVNRGRSEPRVGGLGFQREHREHDS